MSEKKEVVFAEGMYFKAPDERTKEKAPWVKGSVSIKMSDFIPFIKEHKDKEWLNIDLKKSKGGKLYFEVNTWEPTEDQVKEVADDLTGDETEAVKGEEIPW
jgi:hypothetical protein